MFALSRCGLKVWKLAIGANVCLRGEGNQAKFIDLRFERWQVVGFGKGRRMQDVPQIAYSWDE